MQVKKYRPGRRSPWAVYDERGALICLCVYKKGAEAVAARLREASAQAEKPLAAPLARPRGEG
ncbi:MAG: hypothetical protein J7601_11905 [Chloroflexi bacterium]|jgi:hypothetical protein|nr:hypothetical protein [Chloroflexota bacterium]